MIKLIKKAFNWYCRQFEEAYGPIIDAVLILGYKSKFMF